MAESSADDIVVPLDHPHGKVEVSLSEWMRTGPGERPYLRPIAVRSRQTGRSLPLSAIPLPFRNTGLSRSLIKIGVLTNPWKR
jgi:hypothetical protein